MPTNTAIPRKKRKTPSTFYKQKLAIRVVEESVSLFEKDAVSSASKAAKILRAFYDDDTFEYTESFSVLYLNKANAPICWARISEGGMTGTVVDTRVIFAHAVLCGASGIIITHNHPSGNLTPSEADKGMTWKVRKAGEIMDVVLLDHIILSSQGYYSFADEGML